MRPLEKMPPDWLEHGATAKLRKHVEEQCRLAHGALLAACNKTSDTDVAKRYAQFREVESFLKQLGKVNAHGGQDDGE